MEKLIFLTMNDFEQKQIRLAKLIEEQFIEYERDSVNSLRTYSLIQAIMFWRRSKTVLKPNKKFLKVNKNL